MVRITALAVAVLALSLPASAQTLYKLIGKDGKVTYSGEKPKEFDGQVVPIQIDPKANTATMPKFQPSTPPPVASDSKDANGRTESPQERLERAKKALQDAKDNPKDGDLDRIGIKGGGTRPVPTEAYLKRLEELEKAVKDAEEAVRNSR